jgi:hypothetical protein
LTGASTGDALNVSNSTSTGNIAVFSDGSTAVMTLADGGATTFKNQTDSTAAFTVQKTGSGVELFQIDSTNSRVYVGDTTADDVGVILVLDTKTGTSDPTGVNGAMYYNSGLNKFRCYENSAWKDCLGSELYVYKTADQATTSTAMIDITDLTMPVNASTNYRYECSISFASGATSNGWKVSATVPASPVHFGGQATGGTSQLNATVGGSSWNVDDAGGLTTTSSHAGSGNMIFVTGILRNGVNAGNIQMRWRNEVGTSTHTVEQGSYCKYWAF